VTAWSYRGLTDYGDMWMRTTANDEFVVWVHPDTRGVLPKHQRARKAGLTL
jgi:hypothetical protein